MTAPSIAPSTTAPSTAAPATRGPHRRPSWLARRRAAWSNRGDQAGITTAEYAVGTAAGAGLAGLLYTMLSGSFGQGMLTTFFKHVFSTLGIG